MKVEAPTSYFGVLIFYQHIRLVLIFDLRHKWNDGIMGYLMDIIDFIYIRYPNFSIKSSF